MVDSGKLVWYSASHIYMWWIQELTLIFAPCRYGRCIGCREMLYFVFKMIILECTWCVVKWQTGKMRTGKYENYEWVTNGKVFIEVFAFQTLSVYISSAASFVTQVRDLRTRPIEASAVTHTLFMLQYESTCWTQGGYVQLSSQSDALGLGCVVVSRVGYYGSTPLKAGNRRRLDNDI